MMEGSGRGEGDVEKVLGDGGPGDSDGHARTIGERDESNEEFGLGFACVGFWNLFGQVGRTGVGRGCSSRPPRQDDDVIVAGVFSRCGALGVRGA